MLTLIVLLWVCVSLNAPMWCYLCLGASAFGKIFISPILKLTREIMRSESYGNSKRNY